MTFSVVLLNQTTQLQTIQKVDQFKYLNLYKGPSAVCTSAQKMISMRKKNFAPILSILQRNFVDANIFFVGDKNLKHDFLGFFLEKNMLTVYTQNESLAELHILQEKNMRSKWKIRELVELQIGLKLHS